MSNPSKVASMTAKVTSQLPNKRERAASQFGQIDDIVSANWNGDPASLKDAINRLAASMNALLAKLDADSGVTDTNYQSTLKP